MKIVYILIFSLLISACSNTQGSSVYVESEEKNNDSACLNIPDQGSTVYTATEEKSLYLYINRTLDTPHSLGLMVLNDKNNFILNVEAICGVGKNETKLLSTNILTEEQMLAIYNLYENIEVSKLRNLNNQLVTSTDGSSWSLAVVENKKLIESFIVSNPGSPYEVEETKKLFKLGEYLWDIAKIDSLLY